MHQPTNCTDTNAYYELTIDKTQVHAGRPGRRNGIITYDLKVENLGSDSGLGRDRHRPPARPASPSSRPVDTTARVIPRRSPAAARRVRRRDLLRRLAQRHGQCPAQRRPNGPAHHDPRLRSGHPGEYVNLAFVDPANTIPEGNEFNNTRTR